MTGPIDSNGNLHGDDGRFVSLRSYLERVLDERDNRYLERWESQRREVSLAQREMERRLEALNELRNQVLEDRGRFVLRDVHDSEMDARDARLVALENFRAKATGAGIVLGLFAGAVGAAVARAFS